MQSNLPSVADSVWRTKKVKNVRKNCFTLFGEPPTRFFNLHPQFTILAHMHNKCMDAWISSRCSILFIFSMRKSYKEWRKLKEFQTFFFVSSINDWMEIVLKFKFFFPSDHLPKWTAEREREKKPRKTEPAQNSIKFQFYMFGTPIDSMSNVWWI